MNARELLLSAEMVDLSPDLIHTIECYLVMVEGDLLNCDVMARDEIPQAVRNMRQGFKRIIQRWHAANPKCP